MKTLSVLTTKPSDGYELIDSGDGDKLERYGDIVVSRPDPQALWKKSESESEWNNADAYFTRSDKKADWSFRTEVPERWQMELGGLKFWIKPSSFKHTGLFPEHLGNWTWIQEQIRKVEGEVSVLNLFGYTGGATLAAAKAGAQVCHVDGSKVAVEWAKQNAELSGLREKPIRWILDDAVKFVKREIKRGRKYHGIIMDPPAFGHGADGEVWKIEEDFLPFIDLCREVLSDDPLFFLINGYASGYSALAYENNLLDLKEKFGGAIEIGELTIEESGAHRLLPCGIFARWSR